MRKGFKILIVVLSVIFLLCAFLGCELPKITGDKTEDPEPSANYTEEEQVERIIKRTEERFAKEIQQGKIIEQNFSNA